jgi:Ion channel
VGTRSPRCRPRRDRVVACWTATARRAFLVPRVVVPSVALVLVVVGAVEGATRRRRRFGGRTRLFQLRDHLDDGFGDLAPASGVGRAFAVMEIVVGQLYLVTVVAILVAAATRRRLTGS